MGLSQEARETLHFLLNKRRFGAFNINGIYYQLLYSILSGLDLYAEESNSSTIQLEGLEDVDLHVLGSDYFVQVKTSINSWSLSKLKDPLKSFLPIIRINPDHKFKLVFDFQLKNEILNLSQKEFLSEQQRKKIQSRLNNICTSIGYTKAEAEILYAHLHIESISQSSLESDIQSKLQNLFGIEPKDTPIYYRSLFVQFIQWSIERKIITKNDIELLRDSTEADIASMVGSMADTRGYLHKIEWWPDHNSIDWYEGKSTRYSHIASGVDIPRKTWLDGVETAFNRVNVAVIKASSGQGKSAILYRYAHDYWNSKYVYEIKSCASISETEIIIAFLQKKSRLGEPLLLLLDNVGNSQKYWTRIAQECQSLGFYVLVSIREEDWYRYSAEHMIMCEIITPELDKNEARKLFISFKSQNKVHQNVLSADWAFEKIGVPHLLIEYVYLLTHGKMLLDRLREQINMFSTLGEDDKTKIELLRYISVADKLGVPISTKLLSSGITTTSDIGTLLSSVENEFISIDYEDHLLRGLHPVRSSHLSDILHLVYPDYDTTAIDIYKYIPEIYISTYIANMFSGAKDLEALTSKFTSTYKEFTIEQILPVLDGLFEAGEYHFLLNNLPAFDEALSLNGHSCVLLLASERLPLGGVGALQKLSSVIEKDKKYYDRLTEINSSVQLSKRGFDIINTYLSAIEIHDVDITSPENLIRLGRLYDWCNSAKYSNDKLDLLSSSILENTNTLLQIPFSSVMAILYGMGRYSPVLYKEWLTNNLDNILSYVQYHCECISLTYDDNKISFTFFVDQSGPLSVNSQVTARIDSIYQFFPFADMYSSKGLYILPIVIQPSHDESIKNIPHENWFPPSDQSKNHTWIQVVQKQYGTLTWYEFQDAWVRYRKTVLMYVQDIITALESIIKGQSKQVVLPRVNEYSTQLLDIRYNLEPPLKRFGTFSEKESEYISKFQSGFDVFAQQSIKEFLNFKNELTTSLYFRIWALCNELPELHSSFKLLFNNIEDVFAARNLDDIEKRTFSKCTDLIEILAYYHTQIPIGMPAKFILQKRKDKESEFFTKLGIALQSDEVDCTCGYIPHFYEKFPSKYAVIYFDCEDPFAIQESLEKVILRLLPLEDSLITFYVVPTFKGYRYIAGGYIIHSHHLWQIKNNSFTSWESLTFPREIENLPDEYFAVPIQEIAVFNLLGKTEVLMYRINGIVEYYKILSETNVMDDNANLLNAKFLAKAEKCWDDLGTDCQLVLTEIEAISDGVRELSIIEDFLVELKSLITGRDHEKMFNLVEFHREGLIEAANILKNSIHSN